MERSIEIAPRSDIGLRRTRSLTSPMEVGCKFFWKSNGSIFGRVLQNEARRLRTRIRAKFCGAKWRNPESPFCSTLPFLHAQQKWKADRFVPKADRFAGWDARTGVLSHGYLVLHDPSKNASIRLPKKFTSDFHRRCKTPSPTQVDVRSWSDLDRPFHI